MTTEKSYSKTFGFRISARAVPVLEKAIADSGRTQAQFFRMAVEGLLNEGGIAASAFHQGKQEGEAQSGEMMRHFAERLIELAARLEAKGGDQGVESVALAIDDDGEGDEN